MGDKTNKLHTLISKMIYNVLSVMLNPTIANYTHANVLAVHEECEHYYTTGSCYKKYTVSDFYH